MKERIYRQRGMVIINKSDYAKHIQDALAEGKTTSLIIKMDGENKE